MQQCRLGLLGYNAIDSLGVGWMPFINLRFVAFLLAAAVLGGGAWWLICTAKKFPNPKERL